MIPLRLVSQRAIYHLSQWNRYKFISNITHATNFSSFLPIQWYPICNGYTLCSPQKINSVKRRRIISSSDEENSRDKYVKIFFLTRMTFSLLSCKPPTKKSSVSPQKDTSSKGTPAKDTPIKKDSIKVENSLSDSPSKLSDAPKDDISGKEEKAKSNSSKKSKEKKPKKTAKTKSTEKKETSKSSPLTKTIVKEEKVNDSPEKMPEKVFGLFKKTEKTESNGIQDESKTNNDGKKELKLQVAGQGQTGADYDPSKRKYHPIKDAFWKKDDK